jgi:hypothetical protein
MCPDGECGTNGKNGLGYDHSGANPSSQGSILYDYGGGWKFTYDQASQKTYLLGIDTGWGPAEAERKIRQVKNHHEGRRPPFPA